MRKLTDNNYIRAAAGVFLLSAFTHTGILIIFSLINRDITVLNVFKILDIDLFFPEISRGVPNFILSYLFLGAEYLAVLFIIRKK